MMQNKWNSQGKPCLLLSPQQYLYPLSQKGKRGSNREWNQDAVTFKVLWTNELPWTLNAHIVELPESFCNHALLYWALCELCEMAVLHAIIGISDA